MIKTIIFDLGGVILFQNEMKMGKFVSEIFKISLSEGNDFYKPYRESLQIGKISSKNLLLLGKNKFNSVKSVLSLQNEWRELYKKEVIGLNQELINLLCELKPKFKIYLFTNTIDTHAQYFDSFKLPQLFIKFFKSYEVGMRKPDKKTYLFLLKEVKSKPNEIIFVDDLEENVRAAEEVGMKGIIYKNTAQLQIDLRKFGIKT